MEIILNCKKTLIVVGLTFGMCLASLFILSSPVLAATCTWDGSVDANWSTNGNWTGCTVPVDGDSLIFSTGASNTVNTNDITGLSVVSITIDTSGYDIGGNEITLTSDITVSEVVTIGFPITLGDNGITVTSTNPGEINFQGVIDTAAFDALILQGDGIIEFEATSGIQGSGDLSVIMSGGELRLFGLNSTYTGATDLSGSGATTIVDNNSAFGNTSGINGSGAGIGLAANNLSLNYSLSISSGGVLNNGTNNTWAGSITSSGLSGVISTSGDITVSGVVGGSSIVAAGNVTLTNDNTVTVIAVAGTASESVFVNGNNASSAVIIFSGPLTVGGVGSWAGYQCSSGGGVTEVGQAVGSIGTLTLVGDILLDSGGICELVFDADGAIAGVGYDQIVAQGAVSIDDSILDFNINYIPLIGQEFMILENQGGSPITGTFQGLADESTLVIGAVTLSIDYNGGDGDDIVLTVLDAPPQPSSSTTSSSSSSLPAVLPQTGEEDRKFMLRLQLLCLGLLTITAIAVAFTYWERRTRDTAGVF